jgi:hypothetical protein
MYFNDGFPELYSGELIDKIVSGGGGGGSVAWGDVTGNILVQTDLQNQFNNKADQSTMTTALQGKVDVSTYTTGIGAKADKTYVDSGLSGKVDTTTYNTGLGAKADKTYVDNGLSLKADTTTVNNLSTQLSNKADVSSLTSKMDKSGGTFTGLVTGTTINATTLQQGGTNLDSKYAPISGSANYVNTSNYTTDMANKVDVATYNTGINSKVDTTTYNTDMSAKAPLNSPSFTGTVTMTGNPPTVNSGANVTIFKNLNNNGGLSFVSGASNNAIQSVTSAGTGVRDLSIEGYASALLGVINLKATDIQKNGFSIWRTGTAAPSTKPDFVGQFYLDTTNKKMYVGMGTSATADFVILN